jgi:hypothetical protein
MKFLHLHGETRGLAQRQTAVVCVSLTLLNYWCKSSVEIWFRVFIFFNLSSFCSIFLSLFISHSFNLPFLSSFLAPFLTIHYRFRSSTSFPQKTTHICSENIPGKFSVFRESPFHLNREQASVRACYCAGCSHVDLCCIRLGCLHPTDFLLLLFMNGRPFGRRTHG